MKLLEKAKYTVERHPISYIQILCIQRELLLKCLFIINYNICFLANFPFSDRANTKIIPRTPVSNNTDSCLGQLSGHQFFCDLSLNSIVFHSLREKRKLYMDLRLQALNELAITVLIASKLLKVQ